MCLHNQMGKKMTMRDYYSGLIEEMRDKLRITDPGLKNNYLLKKQRIQFVKKLSTIIPLLRIEPEIKYLFMNDLSSISFSLPFNGDEKILWRAGKKDAVNLLNDILSHLDDVSLNKLQNSGKTAPKTISKEQNTSKAVPESSAVFIVYGHDDTMLNAVVRYLTKLEIKYILLEDIPNKGNTIIEKIEKNSNVNYAIILFSPDDHLVLVDEVNKQREEIYRVRQNILIELGIFIGKLGRDRTCTIFKKPEVDKKFDMPSDYQGVAWIAYDDNWKDKLIDELKAAQIIK